MTRRQATGESTPFDRPLDAIKRRRSRVFGRASDAEKLQATILLELVSKNDADRTEYTDE
jgi:hypothetical protein